MIEQVYKVFACSAEDFFDYDASNPLFVSEELRLDQAHNFAYEIFKSNGTWTTIIDWRGDCRGGYLANNGE